MERPQNLNITPRAAIIIIVLFHVVGLVGLSIPATRPLFLQIVPFHLLLMLVVITLGHEKQDNRFGKFILSVFLLGFIAEWVGVHTGVLFGNYAYGKTLGLKLFDIPLMIGVNWFLLVYAVGVTMQRSRLKSPFFRVITGAAILVTLDLLIEPVAVKFDYWQWLDGIIPLKNYICWFLLSVLMLGIFEWFKFKKQGKAAVVLLITEFVFFGALNLMALI
ncbi:carotenoid biosynthesis protein [Mucilaginibacter terrigena]|uniref:Carotenoid biosynthesis protein n=1 Tax=Mucilaginibacter terrigena TaxID=2492395 RepID=A0A4Q5LLH2_9SPHI|nr:carotenoid biosynthesis protein [Mucilaginibacter terrigena]RYU90584.1 carotenoid biosynthesis protein [Mucilaginibacter terrigena]